MHLIPVITGQAAGNVLLQRQILFVIIMLVITGVALLVRRVRIPYTVALVLVGLVLVLIPTRGVRGLPLGLAEELTSGLSGELTSEIILAFLVPPLIFEAALHLGWQRLKQALVPILLMAVPGVLIGTFIVSELVSLQLGIPLAVALIFGALISATDPVAVIAFFRSLGVERELSILVEGESLLNDGVAVVLFTLAIAAVNNELTPTPAKVLLEFAQVAGGGVVVGLLTGFAVAQVLERVDDHLIETTLTMTLAVGSFVLAEQFHVSGILAVVSAGVLIGSTSLQRVSPTTRISLENFWELMAFLANSVIFLLLGLQIDLAELVANIKLIIIAVVAILVSRAVVVYAMTWVSSRLSRPVPLRWRHVMYWGGLRGAVSLALALSLRGAYARQIQLMTFGVVLFTLLVQGLTIERLIKELNLANIVRSLNEQHQLARLFMLRAGRKELDGMRDNGLIAESTWRALTAIAEENIQSILHEYPNMERAVLIEARRETLRAKRSALAEALHRGVISEEVYRRELRDLDTRMLIWERIQESFQRPSSDETMLPGVSDKGDL